MLLVQTLQLLPKPGVGVCAGIATFSEVGQRFLRSPRSTLHKPVTRDCGRTRYSSFAVNQNVQSFVASFVHKLEDAFQQLVDQRLFGGISQVQPEVFADGILAVTQAGRNHGPEAQFRVAPRQQIRHCDGRSLPNSRFDFHRSLQPFVAILHLSFDFLPRVIFFFQIPVVETYQLIFIAGELPFVNLFLLQIIFS